MKNHLLSLFFLFWVVSASAPAAEEEWKLEPIPQGNAPFIPIHYRVALTVPPGALTRPEFSGQVQLTFQSKSNDFKTLVLGSFDLEILKVRMGTTQVERPFRTDGRILEISLDRGYGAGERATVVIDYRPSGCVSLGSSRENNQNELGVLDRGQWHCFLGAAHVVSDSARSLG